MNANVSEVEQFRALVHERLGLVFDDARLDTLAETLRRRVTASGRTGGTYLKRLAALPSTDDEMRHIAQELTVTETFFFRASEHFQVFVESVLPMRIAAVAGTRKVRVLSAGCASGEEPYSLAIAIREAMPWGADNVAIHAVDINQAMLERARRAAYSNWSLRQLGHQQRARWFHAEGALARLDDEVRRAVVFEERNLALDNDDLWRPGSWDAVFCRNMLMYFDAGLMGRIVGRIAGSLVPGGHLFLGHAETLRGLSDDFHLCHTHGTFYYQLKEGGSARAANEPAARREAPATPMAYPPLFEDMASWVGSIGLASQRIDSLALASTRQVGAAAALQKAAAPDLSPVLDLLRREQYGQALAKVNALPQEQSARPDVLLLRAVSAVNGSSLDEAEAACRQLLRGDEFNAGAHYLLALCAEGRGDLAVATEEVRTALYIDAGFAMARLHLGLLLRRAGDVAGARAELSRALPALRGEDAARLLMFGGGFGRDALVALCQAELAKCGGA